MKKGMLTRIIVGIILAAIFIATWLFARAVQTVLYTVIALLCVYEMIHVLKSAGKKVFSAPLYVAAAAMSPMVKYLDIKYFMSLLFVCAVITILSRICDKNGKNEDMLCSLFAYLYPIAPLTVLCKLCFMGSLGFNRLAMLLTFACPLLGDTLAYFFGVCFGKKKLCEHISPKKTVAGGVGGIFGGTLGGVIVYYMQSVISVIFKTAATDYSLYMLAGIGLLLGITGQIGDLFASCIKRWAGVKDYGTIFPGHGGMMDRIDSVLMCAPFVMIAFCL